MDGQRLVDRMDRSAQPSSDLRGHRWLDQAEPRPEWFEFVNCVVWIDRLGPLCQSPTSLWTCLVDRRDLLGRTESSIGQPTALKDKGGKSVTWPALERGHCRLSTTLFPFLFFTPQRNTNKFTLTTTRVCFPKWRSSATCSIS